VQIGGGREPTMHQHLGSSASLCFTVDFLMIGVKLFAIEIEPQKKRTLHVMARRCILYPFRNDHVQRCMRSARSSSPGLGL
jgi:hypothetical protein